FARDAAADETDADTRRGWQAAVWAASSVAGVLMVPLAALAEDATPVLLAAGALMALLVAAARRDAVFDRLAWIAGTLGVLLVAAWEFGANDIVYMLTEPVPNQHAIVPSLAAPVIAAALGFAALLGFGGFAAQWGAARPGRFAAVATAAPLL